MLALALLGCPLPDVASDTGTCFDYVDLHDLGIAPGEIATTQLVDVGDGVPLELQLGITNVTPEDCAVALYVGDGPADLSAAPALSADEAPPSYVPGLGTLAFGRLLASGASTPYSWTGQHEGPTSITVVGCPDLWISGSAYTEECDAHLRLVR